MVTKSFIAKQNFLPELTIMEHIVLWFNVAIAAILFIVQLIYGLWYQPKIWLAFIGSTFNIFSVVGRAKKKVISPFLGIISSGILLALAWVQGLYGSLIMYCINIVMQFMAMISWHKSSKDKIEITSKHAHWLVSLLYLLFFLGLTALFAWVEGLPGFAQFWSGGTRQNPEPLPIRIFDSATLMFIIACFIPMVKRYDQVWYTYIIADTAICLTWLTKGIIGATSGGFNIDQFSNWTMFVSGLCMTITCFIGLFNWKKKAH